MEPEDRIKYAIRVYNESQFDQVMSVLLELGYRDDVSLDYLNYLNYIVVYSDVKSIRIALEKRVSVGSYDRVEYINLFEENT